MFEANGGKRELQRDTDVCQTRVVETVNAETCSACTKSRKSGNRRGDERRREDSCIPQVPTPPFEPPQFHMFEIKVEPRTRICRGKLSQ